MIANFYKTYSNHTTEPVLIITKNIAEIPPVRTTVIYKGERFKVESCEFDLNTCEYNVYLIGYRYYT